MLISNLKKSIEKIVKWDYSPDNPKCPYCGCQECVLDNGDAWYCDACNRTFGNH